MSFVDPSLVEVVAQSMGISELGGDIPRALASDVEYRTREIVQEALKFVRHSKRKAITVEDINSALMLRNIEPLYGFNGAHPPKFVKAVDGLFFLEDEEIVLSDITTAPLPPIPREPRISLHWLAISGISPSIPENPSGSTKQKKEESGISSSAKPSSSDVKTNVVGSSKEMYLPAVKHVVPFQLQQYYERVTEILVSKQRTLVASVLESFIKDSALQQLLPYLAAFFKDSVVNHMNNLTVLENIVLAIGCLTTNPHIYLDAYLHMILPCVITCIVGKKLSENEAEDHWSVRDRAASVLASLCDRYGDRYETLRTRVARSLVHALLDPLRSTSCRYGCLMGLVGLGSKTIEYLIMPNINSILAMVDTNFTAGEAFSSLAAAIENDGRQRCQVVLQKAAYAVLSAKLLELRCAENNDNKSRIREIIDLQNQLYEWFCPFTLLPYVLRVDALTSGWATNFGLTLYRMSVCLNELPDKQEKVKKPVKQKAPKKQKAPPKRGGKKGGKKVKDDSMIKQLNEESMERCNRDLDEPLSTELVYAFW